jgi:copper chaperone CopZ
VPTLKLRIAGLAGPDAEAPLAEALLAEDGVLGAVVSWDAGCLEVDFEDDRVSVTRILEVVEARGYTAELGG